MFDEIFDFSNEFFAGPPPTPPNSTEFTGTNFSAAWDYCDLNMASVENILKSLVASGKTGLSTSMIGGLTVGKSSWVANADPARDAQTNYDILTEAIGVPIHGTTGRGWTIATNA